MTTARPWGAIPKSDDDLTPAESLLETSASEVEACHFAGRVPEGNRAYETGVGRVGFENFDIPTTKRSGPTKRPVISPFSATRKK